MSGNSFQTVYPSNSNQGFSTSQSQPSGYSTSQNNHPQANPYLNYQSGSGQNPHRLHHHANQRSGYTSLQTPEPRENVGCQCKIL